MGPEIFATPLPVSGGGVGWGEVYVFGGVVWRRGRFGLGALRENVFFLLSE